MSEWREGARSGDPHDVCPGCGAQGVIFASDFKVPMLGKKSVRACVACHAVYVNGKKQSELEVER